LDAGQGLAALRRQLESYGDRLVLLEAAGQASGADLEFLDRWGYDPEQRRAISEAALAVAE
jgi:hypothetical protein